MRPFKLSVSVEFIVKLGYAEVILVAPDPVNATVKSGAVFWNTVPLRLRPVPVAL